MSDSKTFDEIAAKVRKDASPAELEASRVYVDEATRLIELALSVRSARISASLTQTELSKISGITQAEISRIEGAKYAPRIGTLFRLATALNTTFVIGADAKTPALAS